MKIYLMRHGHSPSALEAGVESDAERPLSKRGREDARRAARHLLARGARPALILVSPLLRARATAAEAAAELRPAPPERVFTPLDNRVSGAELLPLLLAEADAEEVLVVGHQPQLGDAVQSLLDREFHFQPAGVAALECSRGTARLLWAANPQDISDGARRT
ncbi:MAG TPA: histidine phosphatase family protein [Elusimicrobiota bacterium]|jgi:phosphohistidine phosphatase|nr:histidine phosphatase family protein [Elusimicrobiota bacterium]